MNQNRVRRKANNRHSQFFIRRYERAFGPEAAYVESVCASLIESRFGPGRLIPVFVVLTDRPELEPAVFYDLTDDGMSPCYALSPLGRAGYQVVEAAYRKAQQMEFVTTRTNRFNSTATHSPNQERGSP